jgi:hypothetical protein
MSGVFASHHARLMLAATMATCLSACLPGDTRPVPSSVELTVGPVFSAHVPILTHDGWTIAYDRFLMGLGALQLEGRDCIDYSSPRYTRIFDFAAGELGREKVALAHGLGPCDLSFEISAPEGDALLGSGATAADFEAMRAEADDVWIAEPERTSVRMAGRALRGSVTKEFDWMFRMEYDIQRCFLGDDVFVTELELFEAGFHELNLVVNAVAPFEDAGGAERTFDRFAEADTDGDGRITFEELDAAELPPPPDTSDEEVEEATLLDLLYGVRVPKIVHPLETTECEIELDRR